jgi:OOP family OmpA-OmpF porin
MRKIVSAFAAVSTLVVLTACAGNHPPGYTDVFGKWGMQFEAIPVQREARSYAGRVQGGAYNQALYTETMEHANYEYDKMEDWRDAMFHARNAITVAQGGTYQPTELSQWRLPGDKVDELSSARSRLVAALNSGAPERNPEASARALAKFNCWVEQQEENFQPRDIAYCRDAFYAALEQIEQKRAEFPEVVGLQADVFFDFDKSNIRADARPILDDLARMLVQDTSVQVLVWGFTDTMGSNRYNQGLSERRANSVASYLSQQGVTRDRMTIEGFGETRLAVQTPDQTPEPRNRRVEIRRR